MKKYNMDTETNIITYDNFIDSKNKRIKQFFYIKDIKYTLDKLNILPKQKQTHLKKNELKTTLFEFYRNIETFNKHFTQIVFLQRIIKKYLKNKLTIEEPSNNDCDFYTFVPIKEIPKEYLFSYKDSKNFIYSFDIRSFQKLLDTNKENPYNRELISNDIINKFNNKLKNLEQNNIEIIPYETIILTPKQQFKNRVFNVFQTIDLLNIVAGGTNINWFLNLNIKELKHYYKVLEDIWNYRAELSSIQKQEIIDNHVMFPKNVFEVFNSNNIQELREIILKEMEKIIFTSDDDNHRSTGGYYILIAFVEISQICAQAMPWLIQY